MELKAAEVKVIYRTKIKPADRYEVKSSQQAYDLLLKYYDEETIELKEYFKVVLLNPKIKVLGIYNLGEGGIDGVHVDVRQILQLAILTNATSIMVSHNHPSGGIEPSLIDRKLTTAIDEACKLLNIRLLDHIILTPFDYYSFADNGLL